MIDERLEALFWKEIEGGLSGRERQILDRRLERDAEARAARARLAQLNSELASLEMRPPPPELRLRIREAVAHRAGRSKSSFWDGLRAALTPFAPGRARFAYLVAGIFVGVVVSLVLARTFDEAGPVDPRSFYGAANVGGVEWLEIELPADANVVRLRREGSDLITAWTSDRAVELRVERAQDGSVEVEVSAGGVALFERRVEWTEIPGR